MSITLEDLQLPEVQISNNVATINHSRQNESQKELEQLLSLTDLDKIEDALEWLASEETKVEKHLGEILDTKTDIENGFDDLFNLLPLIEEAQDEIQPLNSGISYMYNSIRDLHAEIKLLNEEKLKIENTEKLVKEGQDLLNSIKELELAISDKDILSSSAIVHKCLRIIDSFKDLPDKESTKNHSNSKENEIGDIKLLKLKILEQVGVSYNNQDISDVLEEQRVRVLNLVNTSFEDAVHNNDNKTIGICFKQYPLLREENLGLDKYTKLLCEKVSENYKQLKVKSGIEGAFMLRLANLFDSMAYLIDSNFNIVNRYYGPGRMTRVIQRFQLELDKRVVRILEAFEDERQIARLQLEAINTNKIGLDGLSALSRKLQADNLNSSIGGQGMSWKGVRTPQSSALKPQNRPSESHSDSESQAIDLKIVSKAVNELAMMANRSETFLRYLQQQGELNTTGINKIDSEIKNIFLSAETIVNEQSRNGILVKDVYSGIKDNNNTLRVDQKSGLLVGTQLEQLLGWMQKVYLEFEKYSTSRAFNKALMLDDVEKLEGWGIPISGDNDSVKNKGSSGGFLSQFSSSSFTKGSSQEPKISLTSSCTGDVFYVIQIALYRAISIQKADVFSSLVSIVAEMLKSSYVGLLEREIQLGWVYPQPGSVTNKNYLSQDSRSPRSSSESTFRPSKEVTGMLGLGSSDWKMSLKNSLTGSTFGSALGLAATGNEQIADQQKRICVGLNNLDVSISYLSALCDGLLGKIKSSWAKLGNGSPNDSNEQMKAEEAIQSLNSISSKMSMVLVQGLNQLSNQALKLRIRQSLKESYLDIKYVLSDEEFADTQNDNLFQQRMFMKLDSLLKPFKARLTENNGNTLIELVIDVLVADWQRAILQSKFNLLGGLAFERDVKSVQNYFEMFVTSNIRPKFSKLVQMSQIMTSSISELEKEPSPTNIAGSNENEKGRNNSILNSTQHPSKTGIVGLGTSVDELPILSVSEISTLVSNRLNS
ncbi:hypothetical protein BB559_001109 [Furculomyces boomerangus]|uniref:COG4 transport protein middle alpha-helical bundle domain-containing protein n=1 Tax=Furculomyces boomerangus TaxID=61424 RepID=A0A2T9Z302_9FUNG|nr:hypothetical protein BB559_001109 [Furculomyces boomerangus]